MSKPIFRKYTSFTHNLKILMNKTSVSQNSVKLLNLWKIPFKSTQKYFPVWMLYFLLAEVPGNGFMQVQFVFYIVEKCILQNLQHWLNKNVFTILVPKGISSQIKLLHKEDKASPFHPSSTPPWVLVHHWWESPIEVYFQLQLSLCCL